MGIFASKKDSLSIPEIFGLTPYADRLRDAVLTFRGDPFLPKARVDLTSLRQLKPALSVKTWAGWSRQDKRTVISNLFNRTPTSPTEGWSVRVTQVLDFRGGSLTYDSHNGTDFALPLGTPIVASAPGLVGRVSSEFHRGGLKVVVDHGQGIMTTYNHLGRALVKPGDRVKRGEVIALSGYSGIDGLLLFPWSVPHLHYNVMRQGRHDDPFAAAGEVAMWRHGNDPRPLQPGEEVAADADFAPTPWDAIEVDRAISQCLDPVVAKELRGIVDLHQRATSLYFTQCYYPTRFGSILPIAPQDIPRQPLLDLPMRSTDFVGVHFADAGEAPPTPVAGQP